MSARQQRVSSFRPESMLWDARRGSWVMVVPNRAFIDGSEPREERRRSTIVTHHATLPEGPTVSWAIAGVVIALLAIVCALVALL